MKNKTQKALAVQAQESQGLLEDVRAFPLETDEDKEALADILIGLKEEMKALDAKKKEVTAPMNVALKAFRAWFRPVEDIYAQTEAEGKRRLLAYDRDRRIRQQKDLAVAVETQDRTALIRATIPEKKIDNIQKRKVWRVRIVDKAQVPLDYMVVDERRLLAEARKGGKAPAGVEFYQEETLALGGR